MINPPNKEQPNLYSYGKIKLTCNLLSTNSKKWLKIYSWTSTATLGTEGSSCCREMATTLALEYVRLMINLQMALKLKGNCYLKIHWKLKQNYLFSCHLIFVFAQNSVSRWHPLSFYTHKKTNMAGKDFEHQQTLNASEYVIFLVNLWIVLNFRDCCNLKV